MKADSKVTSDMSASCNNTRRRGWFVVAAVGLLLTAIMLTLILRGDHVSMNQARQLVERYNQVVSEAYRRSDVRLIDPVVGINEGRKLTGLIGVRQDLGLGLDAELLTLDITGVEQSGDELRVRTEERWQYKDVKLANGEPVGEASHDSYAMLYLFKREPQGWFVDEIQFTSPPQVERTQTPWVADHSSARQPLTLPANEKVQLP